MNARWPLVALLLLGAWAAPADPPAAAGPVVFEQVTGSPPEEVASALDRIDDPALPAPLVDPARVVSGDPPPDGIPPIHQPRFEPAGAVGWLIDDEPALAPAIGQPARAYPVRG